MSTLNMVVHLQTARPQMVPLFWGWDMALMLTPRSLANLPGHGNPRKGSLSLSQLVRALGGPQSRRGPAA